MFLPMKIFVTITNNTIIIWYFFVIADYTGFKCLKCLKNITNHFKTIPVNIFLNKKQKTSKQLTMVLHKA